MIPLLILGATAVGTAWASSDDEAVVVQTGTNAQNTQSVGGTAAGGIMGMVNMLIPLAVLGGITYFGIKMFKAKA